MNMETLKRIGFDISDQQRKKYKDACWKAELQMRDALLACVEACVRCGSAKVIQALKEMKRER